MGEELQEKIKKRNEEEEQKQKEEQKAQEAEEEVKGRAETRVKEWVKRCGLGGGDLRVMIRTVNKEFHLKCKVSSKTDYTRKEVDRAVRKVVIATHPDRN